MNIIATKKTEAKSTDAKKDVVTAEKAVDSKVLSEGPKTFVNEDADKAYDARVEELAAEVASVEAEPRDEEAAAAAREEEAAKAAESK